MTSYRNALASTGRTTVPPDKFSPSDKTSKQRVAPETTCCNTSHASSSSCSGPYSSNFGILSSSQGACPLELDLFETILRGRWTTVHFIPPSLRDLWAGVFTTALSQFNTSPTLRSFARLSATTKVLLAAPKHGGKAREDATERCIRARINMWMGGRENEVCLQVITNARKLKPRIAENSEKSTMRRVQYLVNAGLVSKACHALCSRGVAQLTASNIYGSGFVSNGREYHIYSTNRPSGIYY